MNKNQQNKIQNAKYLDLICWRPSQYPTYEDAIKYGGVYPLGQCDSEYGPVRDIFDVFLNTNNCIGLEEYPHDIDVGIDLDGKFVNISDILKGLSPKKILDSQSIEKSIDELEEDIKMITIYDSAIERIKGISPTTAEELEKSKFPHVDNAYNIRKKLLSLADVKKVEDNKKDRFVLLKTINYDNLLASFVEFYANENDLIVDGSLTVYFPTIEDQMKLLELLGTFVESSCGVTDGYNGHPFSAHLSRYSEVTRDSKNAKENLFRFIDFMVENYFVSITIKKISLSNPQFFYLKKEHDLITEYFENRSGV